MNTSFSFPEVKDLCLKAGNIEFDTILRLDGIDAMVSVLHLAFQEGEDPPSESTIHAYCALINMEIETIKKDLEKMMGLMKERC